ncbi:sugar ABC transporter substrate-binding protein [Oceaniglobus trochenteri]|uniref:sugar ABC transporter substrate-binding protein n=1 Tax=Oceaniglobus trochenteri TaxID=2763260 RepID=UPI001CFF5922|nr:sugar ABC transporter substrate-binding protein [Oceaniglobus trochenteri]
MMLKTLAKAAAIALATSALAGPLAAQDRKMGYTAIDLTNPYFIALTDGMKQRADELGIALTIHDGKSDPASQVSAIENFIVQQMDAILVSPIDPRALEPLVDQVKMNSIPMISVAQGVPGSDAFLGLDEREYGLSIGRIAGQYIVDNMGGQAEVAILTYPELAPVILRGEGIRDGILEIAPEAKVVAEQSAATPETGAAAIEAIMQAHPNVRVVAGINDAGVLGAYEALAGMGVPTEEFALFGLDATPEALARMRDGGMYKATVDIAPVEAGKSAIDLAIRVIESGPVADMIVQDMVPVTAETLSAN